MITYVAFKLMTFFFLFFLVGYVVGFIFVVVVSPS